MKKLDLKLVPEKIEYNSDKLNIEFVGNFTDEETNRISKLFHDGKLCVCIDDEAGKEKPVVNLLEYLEPLGFETETGRAVGNTTRLIDFAIQLLFKGAVVNVQDHHDNGENYIVNRELKRKIIKRLENEHPNAKIKYSAFDNKLELKD